MKIWNKIKSNIRNRLWKFLCIDKVLEDIFTEQERRINVLRKGHDALKISVTLRLKNLEKRNNEAFDGYCYHYNQELNKLEVAMKKEITRLDALFKANYYIR